MLKWSVLGVRASPLSMTLSTTRQTGTLGRWIDRSSPWTERDHGIDPEPEQGMGFAKGRFDTRRR